MLSNNLSKTYLCGGYLRLSHSDEVAFEDEAVAGIETLRSNSIENQKEYIEDYLHSKSEIKLVDFYIDDGLAVRTLIDLIFKECCRISKARR